MVPTSSAHIIAHSRCRSALRLSFSRSFVSQTVQPPLLYPRPGATFPLLWPLLVFLLSPSFLYVIRTMSPNNILFRKSASFTNFRTATEILLNSRGASTNPCRNTCSIPKQSDDLPPYVLTQPPISPWNQRTIVITLVGTPNRASTV